MTANRIVYILVAMFFSCCAAHKSQRIGQDILKAIYENEKSYYESNIDNKIDFKPMIGFASKGRSRLYRENKFYFERSVKYILLEGFVNGNGRYAGIVLSDNASVAYNNTISKGWQFLKLKSVNIDSLAQFTGISQNVIEKVRNWNVGYINNLKHSVGSAVADGFSFIASRIETSNESSATPTIKTIAFYEFK